MGSQSQGEGDELPGCGNHFETARLGVFATPGSPQALAIPNFQLQNPGSMKHLWIERIWQRRGLFNKVLWLLCLPASFGFLLLTEVRNFCYSRGWISSRALGRPVISVGNLTVGGTGKTPTALWLAQKFAVRGLKVGILSRGYKRLETGPVILGLEKREGAAGSDGFDPAAAGDEPAMMARIYGQTVSVYKDRFCAGQELLARRDVDVFVLDDGFQHRRLKRDAELLLLGEGARGNVLPAGPFRESKRSLQRADFLLITGAEERWRLRIQKLGGGPCFRGGLQATMLIACEKNHWREYPLNLMSRSKVLAVTGIADPSRLYQTIHEWEGEVVNALEFPDHHRYTVGDWQRINREARNLDLIITTEKDILKLVRFPFAREKLFAVRVAMVIENEETLIDGLLEKVRRMGWRL
jgi:tetraacyldisaccharide 4'-kinase